MAGVNVLKKKRPWIKPNQLFLIDYWLGLAIAGLIVIGMLMVYSTTFDLGILAHDEATYYFKRQFLALGLGLVGIVFFVSIDYHALRRWSVPVMLFTLIMLVVVLLFGQEIFGARRGLISGSVQPSEVAKLAIILYITHWLSTKGDRIKDLTYGLVPFSIITGTVCALIVLQPDVGTAGLIAVISLALFFIAGADLKQFAFAGGIGVGIFLILVTILPHAAARIESFREAWQDPTQASWQVKQSVVALGSGGWFGVGLGESTQKFGPLPVAHTDGVFAILGEELGLFGCVLVMAMLAILCWRGIRAALGARDSYGFLLAVGITLWLTFQSLIHIGVITAVVPSTGMPLPFLSYGGSSLTISLFAVGILLSISRDAAINVKVQRWKPIRESLRESIDLRRRNGRTHFSGPGSRR
jgi:cell division protein FtsW